MAGTAYIDYELLERLALRLFVGAVFLLILVHFWNLQKRFAKVDQLRGHRNPAFRIYEDHFDSSAGFDTQSISA